METLKPVITNIRALRASGHLVGQYSLGSEFNEDFADFVYQQQSALNSAYLPDGSMYCFHARLFCGI